MCTRRSLRFFERLGTRLYSCMHAHLHNTHACTHTQHTLASSPGPSPPRRALVLMVYTCTKYFFIFHKSFVHLPCSNKEYKAFQRDLTCRILLEYYFSDVAFFHKLKQKGNNTHTPHRHTHTNLQNPARCGITINLHSNRKQIDLYSWLV